MVMYYVYFFLLKWLSRIENACLKTVEQKPKTKLKNLISEVIGALSFFQCAAGSVQYSLFADNTIRH